MKNHFQKILLAFLTVSQIGILGALVISPGAFNVPANTVGTAALRVATGSATSGAGASMVVNMNTHTFFPHFGVSSAGYTCSELATIGSDPGTSYDAGVSIYAEGGCGTNYANWRYMTASDNPYIEVVYDASGNIIASFTADDPCGVYPNKPCLDNIEINDAPCIDCTRKVFNSNDIPSLPTKVSEDIAALKYIQDRNYSISNLSYRKLQQYSKQDAPSKFIFEKMKVNPLTKNLECKNAC